MQFMMIYTLEYKKDNINFALNKAKTCFMMK